MNLMFAQAQIDSAPASFVKWFFVVLFALVLVAAAVTVIAGYFRKPEKMQIEDNPPPQIGKAPKRFNYELCVEQHRDINRRVTELENWRTQLVNKMDKDKYEILLAGDQRAKGIYQHIDSVRRELDIKITAIPNETVALLKNTGAI